MGIALTLFQVDHENLVVRGLPLLSRAEKTGDPGPLRALLAGVAFDESKEELDTLSHRAARLRQAGASGYRIAELERRLAWERRPTPEALARAELWELYWLLGRWSANARSLNLAKSWDLLHWYCDPGRRRRAEADWRAAVGPGTPSPFDLAFHGALEPARAGDGVPLFRTRGGDPVRYNPPAVVRQAAAALAAASTAGWESIDAELEARPDGDRPYLGTIDNRLAYAGAYFPRLVHFYQGAARRGFGVSVEFFDD
jgi:hypothetical protein